MINKQMAPFFRFLLRVLAFNLSMINFTYAGHIDNLRGQRYCEVILSPSLKSLREVNVYNTIGLNQCPIELWNKITVASIKKETGAKFVHLNGPRYWIIDGMTGSTKLVNKTPRKFGGIEMRQAAVLDLSWSDIMSGSKPYETHIVNR